MTYQYHSGDYSALFGCNQTSMNPDYSQFVGLQQPYKGKELDLFGCPELDYTLGLSHPISPAQYSPPHSASSSPPHTPTNGNWAVAPIAIEALSDPLPVMPALSPLEHFLSSSFEPQPAHFAPFSDPLPLQMLSPSIRTEHTSLDTYFLQPHQSELRQLLDTIMQQPWYLANEKEPDVNSKRSVLTRFLRRTDDGQSFKCLFDGCDKNFDRQDRAVGHIRMHIGLRPFACGGRCKEPLCTERFFCPSYLASHMKRPMKTCDKCHQSFHKQPMRRHSVTCTGPPLMYRPY